MGGAILALVVIALFAYSFYYENTDHWHCARKKWLRENATVIELDVKRVGSRTEPRYRTIVRFDDGSKYVSHRTDIEDHFLYKTIKLTKEEKERILIEGMAVHADAIRKRDYKKIDRTNDVLIIGFENTIMLVTEYVAQYACSLGWRKISEEEKKKIKPSVLNDLYNE